MKPERSLSPDEQERLEERSLDMSQSFMWCRHIPLKERIMGTLWKFLTIGLPMLAICIAAGWVLVELGTDMSPAQKGASIGAAALAGLATEIACFLWVFVLDSERRTANPPVFLFFDDKLWRVESDGTFDRRQVPHIPAGEMSALRERLHDGERGMSNKQIEAQCFYLAALKQHDIGNGTKGLDITVVEDIVDVDVDEDDAGTFVVTYDDRFGEEVEMRIPMEEFSELYAWLEEQLMRD